MMKTIDKNVYLKTSTKSNMSNYSRSKPSEPRTYGQWIKSLLVDYHKRHGTNLTFYEFLAECVFFNTITFDQRFMRDRKFDLDLMDHDNSIEMDAFHTIYGAASKHLLGRRWCQAKRSKRPLAFVILDFDGSRYSSILTTRKNPHLHVIWAVHPDLAERLKTFFGGAFFRFRVRDLRAIDGFQFDPYNEEQATIDELASYTAKTMYRSVRNPQGGDEIRIYRDDEFNRYRSSRSYETRSQTWDRMIKAIHKDAAF